MKVKAIYPEIVATRCEAARVKAYISEKLEADKRCKHTALYIIDGRGLCKKHAMAATLDAALEQGE